MLCKLIIVDDEILIRVGIKSCIDWEQYGFEVVGQAEDGEQAFELIRNTLPQIVLTDIKMPNMDGLKLISAVKKSYPWIKIIVLSGYNELDYVKQAMKLGAEDYILKLSMQPESLLEIMIRTKQLIEEEKKEVEADKYLKDEVRINKLLIKENLYKKMLSSSMTIDDFKSELARLNIDLKSDKYTLLCCGVDDYQNAPLKSKIGNQHLFKYSLKNILDESMFDYYKGDIAEIDDGKYLILIDHASEEIEYNKETITKYCKNLNNACKKYLNISISFGCILFNVGYDKLKEKCMQTINTLEYRFYFGKESIIFDNEIAGFNDKKPYFNSENEKSLQSCFENFYSDGAKAIIIKFFNELQCSKEYKPSKVKLTSVEIFHVLVSIAKKFNVDFELLISGYEKHPLDLIMGAETLTDIRNLMEEYIDKLMEYISFIKLNEIRPEIMAIKQYITEHLDEDISLERAAKISNISKSYFSSIFKKETGESFTDYVNRKKMEKAKEIILKYDLKAYEVADKVGIADESYFRKLYKKYIGCSPGKFKRDLK